MSDWIEVSLPDVPGLHVTTGRGEVFHLVDDPDMPEPEITGLGAAVMVTRLRWWADRIESRAKAQEDA